MIGVEPVNQAVLPNGAERSVIAASIARLFACVITGDMEIHVAANYGWQTALGVVAAQEAADGGNGIAVTVKDLAEAMYRNYQRAMSEPEESFGSLHPLLQLAWEACARYAAWAVGEPEAAGGGHSDGEAHFIEWAAKKMAERDIVR